MSHICSLTAHGYYPLARCTLEEKVRVDTPDISEFAQFTWYQWVGFHDPRLFPQDWLQLGRWLGVTSSVGQALTLWVLNDNAQVLARLSVTPIMYIEVPVPHLVMILMSVSMNGLVRNRP